MDKIELSETTKEICRENYKTNCGGCPLRIICVDRNVHTKEQINEQARKLNELSDRLIEARRS